MTVRVAEMFDTLPAAGALEEQARKAAETLARGDQRIAKMDTASAVLEWIGRFTLAGATGLLSANNPIQ